MSIKDPFNLRVRKVAAYLVSLLMSEGLVILQGGAGVVEPDNLDICLAHFRIRCGVKARRCCEPGNPFH